MGPLTFNDKDPEHMVFLMSGARLIAENYCIPVNTDENFARKIVNQYQPKPFQPKNVVIATTTEEAKEQAKKRFEEEDVDCIKKTLPAFDELGDLKMKSINFEKDDPSNGHIDFISSCANLRAINYSIKTVSKHEAKRIS